jgi:hypothetical protein
MSGETLNLRGILKGHAGWVTSIATTAEASDMIISGSRGTPPPILKFHT